MLGLIYRELHMAKKNIGVCLTVFLLFSVWVDLVALSARIGNIKKYVPAQELPTVLAYVPIAAFACFAIALVAVPESIYFVMESDFQSAWLKYALATPKTAWELVGAKYVATLLLLGAACVLGGTQYYVSCALAGLQADAFTWLAFGTLTCLVALFFFLFLPVSYYFQNALIFNILMTIPFVIGAWWLAIKMIQSNEKFGFDYLVNDLSTKIFTWIFQWKHAWLLKGLLPILTIAVMMISFWLSAFFLEKRRLVISNGKGMTHFNAHGKGKKRRD